MKVKLLTGRTIDQGVGKERGKISKEYLDSVSICYIDPEDLDKLAIKEGTNVLVATDYGSVVLKAVKSLRNPHKGSVFVPYGPWVNMIVDPETNSIGMPSYKGIPAKVTPAPDKSVLNLEELLKTEYIEE
ncbi:MAG: molybdopterin dinucleotide binding domain-containing protein [Candidatus Bathyarchaeota archaeon]